MSVRSKHEKDIAKRSVIKRGIVLFIGRGWTYGLTHDFLLSLEEVAKLITENGGKVVGLDEPKLTHVILDRRDDSRRVELMKRTSK